MDSDCIPTSTTIAGYCSSYTCHIGFSGLVESDNRNTLSKYYDSQEILIAPEAIDCQHKRPDYLITANCLIHRVAFLTVGGFDESFVRAGGEDIDIAFRLLEIGTLQYQHGSLVRHDFSNSLMDFIERFYRYGVGDRMIAEKYGLSLRPSPFFHRSYQQ